MAHLRHMSDPTADDKLPMKISRRGAWVVVRPEEASLMDGGVIELLGNKLDALAAGGEAKIVLDFKRVQYISSAMIGVLVSGRQSAVAAGGQLLLAGLNDRLLQLLKLTRLDKMFVVHPDARSALKSVGAVE